MKVSGLVFPVILLATCCFGGGKATTIPSGSKIYVEQNEFGNYIVSAIEKKNVPVALVAEKEAADYLIVGTADTERAGWARTLALGQTGSSETASINVVSVKTKEIIWGYSVHKRNSYHGKQSAAEACAKHLKEIIAR